VRVYDQRDAGGGASDQPDQSGIEKAEDFAHRGPQGVSKARRSKAPRRSRAPKPIKTAAAAARIATRRMCTSASSVFARDGGEALGDFSPDAKAAQDFAACNNANERDGGEGGSGEKGCGNIHQRPPSISVAARLERQAAQRLGKACAAC
jgi:hypothetical protein